MNVHCAMTSMLHANVDNLKNVPLIERETANELKKLKQKKSRRLTRQIEVQKKASREFESCLLHL